MATPDLVVRELANRMGERDLPEDLQEKVAIAHSLVHQKRARTHLILKVTTCIKNITHSPTPDNRIKIAELKMVDIMSRSVPSLKIIDPGGSERELKLERDRYTIGRIPELNDIALVDLEGIITRQSHCLLKKIEGSWWIEDRSTNGTILTRQQTQVQLQELRSPKIELFCGDRILIHNWQLIFSNPSQSLYNTTKNLGGLIFKSKYQTPFVFNVTELNLYQVQTEGKLVVSGLRPKARDLLSYMARQNLDNGNQATICSYQNIIDTLWQMDESSGVGNEDIYTLVKEIRKSFKEAVAIAKIEDRSSQWLETIKKKGLRLNIDCEM